MTYGNLLDRDSIARFLDEQDGKDAKNALTLRRDDARVDWISVCEVPSEANPSVDVGQRWAVRCKLGNGRALHILGRDDVVVMHVDKHDPGIRPVPHLVGETNLATGTLVGGIVGLVAMAFGASPALAVASTAAGAAIGASVPVEMKVWQYDGIDAYGRFKFSERVGVTPQLLLARR